MHINDLIKIKLKDDLFTEIMNRYESNDLNYNRKLFKKIINKKIENKIKNITLLDNKKFDYDEANCISRIWDNHRGSRCKYKKKEGNDYCLHHLNMINRNGYLRFGNYNDIKPKINDKGNIIPWIEISEIDTLNNIINNDINNIRSNINYKLRKKRIVTPRF